MFSILGWGVVKFVVLIAVLVIGTAVICERARWTGCNPTEIINGSTDRSVREKVITFGRVFIICTIPKVGILYILYKAYRFRNVHKLSPSKAEDLLRKRFK